MFVFSWNLKKVPERQKCKVSFIQISAKDVTEKLNHQGYKNLYVDGGRIIQSFLHADFIDEMIISKIPILLGGAVPLFDELPEHKEFEFISVDPFT